MNEIEPFAVSDEKREWNRMRDESPKAHAAFRRYLEMGEQRGVQRVATQLSKSRTLISRWAQRWKWKERAKFYDDFVNDQQMRAFIAERQAMGRRQAQTAVLGQNVATRGLMQLEAALQQAGQTRQLKIHELARLFDVCSKVERICRGEPDQNQVASINVTISMQTKPRYEEFADLRENPPKFDS
jgi:hypothetical protein